MEYQRKQDGAVILPTLKITEKVSYFLKFLAPINVSAKPKQDGTVGEIAVARVLNLQDNKQYTMVCGQLLKEAMLQIEYVGKSFEVIKTPVDGKRFKKYEIYEIEAK